MSLILKIIIKLYWFIVPEHKRRSCIYRTSCSHQVYKTVSEKGFIRGIREFHYRFKTCRPNHEVIFMEKQNVILVKLSDGNILKEQEIAHRIIERHKLR